MKEGFFMFGKKKKVKHVIAKLLRKSANKLPTSGTNKNALTDGAYFSHSACIFAIAFGVAPIPLLWKMIVF